MLENYRVALQLVAFRVVLSSIELVRVSHRVRIDLGEVGWGSVDCIGLA
jgi:hypothetical protein